MKIIKFTKDWTVKDANELKDYMFIYGDNLINKGIFGQAVIRYCDNAYGIPTKKYPSYKSYAYMTDNEYETNIKYIDTAIDKIIKILSTKKYIGVVISYSKLGSGYAKLNITAPKTDEYLQKKYINMLEIIEKL